MIFRVSRKFMRNSDIYSGAYHKENKAVVRAYNRKVDFDIIFIFLFLQPIRLYYNELLLFSKIKYSDSGFGFKNYASLIKSLFH
jgi:hypothetical protein